MLLKFPSPCLDRQPRKGQVFNLPLPTLVSGQDAFGKTFEEPTVLFYISDGGATFNLKNALPLGARLKLSIDLPPPLAEDKNLKLIINGRVALIEAPEANSNRQRISLRFESRYIIQSGDEH
jgi:hypothetical protein